jgi:DNA-directed RNA polymerase subunit RPC12/RpoP
MMLGSMVIETCSHCGKHICEKHWNNCKMGEEEDTWILCPDCSKLVEIKNEPNDDMEDGYFPVVKATGERMELPYW